jgi:hypothetical protein
VGYLHDYIKTLVGISNPAQILLQFCDAQVFLGQKGGKNKTRSQGGYSSPWFEKGKKYYKKNLGSLPATKSRRGKKD